MRAFSLHLDQGGGTEATTDLLHFMKHHLILYDPEGLIARIISSTRKLLERSEARKTSRSNTWEWNLKKIGFPGGIDL